jgi:hypothetical protein
VEVLDATRGRTGVTSFVGISSLGSLRDKLDKLLSSADPKWSTRNLSVSVMRCESRIDSL